MTESSLGIGIFIISGFIVASLIHAKLKKFFLACLLSSILISVVYQLIGILVLGYLDPFFMIAFINTTIIAFIISIISGIPFAYMRRKKKRGIAGSDLDA